MNYCNCPNCRTDNCPAAIDDSTRSETPSVELANLSDVWRRHASQCDGDLRLALESCAMDLDRLRDSYCAKATTQTEDKALAGVRAEVRRTQHALEYCLRTLKHHHLNKPGIAATVEETEWLLTPSAYIQPTDARCEEYRAALERLALFYRGSERAAEAVLEMRDIARRALSHPNKRQARRRTSNSSNPS